MAYSSSSSPPQHFFFFFFFPFLSLAQSPVDIDGPNWDFRSSIYYCLSRQSYFSQSQFSKNLNNIVSSIPTLHPNTYNFYTFYNGTNSDQERAEAMGLCNRVLTQVECLNCVAQAATNLTTVHCPNSREAYVRSTKCMFRYSDKPIFGKLETNPITDAPNPNTTTEDRNQYIRMQSELLNQLRLKAALSGPKRKYAQGDGPSPLAGNKFFASVQCTPDLSKKDCSDCLTYGFNNMTKGRVGYRWFCPSCNFQIENNVRFFRLESEYEPDVPIGPGPGAEPGKHKLKTILAIASSVVGFAIIVACLYFLLTRIKRKEKPRHEGKDVEENKIKDAQLLQLDFDTIRLATNDFSPDNQLGEGGFGAVYKGVLDYGEEIAVKRLSMNSGQGDNEFVNEVSLVAKLQHRNLVRLLGFCLDGQERLLIYEFFKNTSLNNFIFESNRRMILEWESRYRIITGIAKGLLYLHEDSRFKIVHRDLKASNVLLDDALNPKIADFGLAKLFDTDQTSQTRTASRVAGTYGYMAPEYAMKGQCSVKTDVFSFGVLVIEIITGKRNNWSPEEHSYLFLLSYVWKSWREGKILNIVDPSLIETRGLSDEIMKCIHIGLLCVQDNAENRPTMASVVVMLNANSFTLPRPSQPGFYLGKGESAPGDNRTSSIASLNDVTITDLESR